MEPDRLEPVLTFAGIFLARAPANFLGARSTDALAHLVLATFRFLDRSQPNRVDVEVVNPELVEERWTAPVTVVRSNISDRPFIVDTIREYLHSQDLAIEYLT